jgi:hypothetical protein
MTMQPKKDPRPENASHEELALFWDTHDVMDYVEEMKSVQLRVAPKFTQGMTVLFDPQTVNTIKVRASKVGVKPATLIRMWVLERLYEKIQI